jgi:hypothetical protein
MSFPINPHTGRLCCPTCRGEFDQDDARCSACTRIFCPKCLDRGGLLEQCTVQLPDCLLSSNVSAAGLSP